MNEVNPPLYLKIYRILLEDIKNGKYKGGLRLPSEKELSNEYKVSRITSKKALEILANNGYINRMPGKGSYVREGDEQNNIKADDSLEAKSNNVLIGVIIPDFSNSYGLKLFMSLQNEAFKNNSFIVPCFSYGRQELEEKAISKLINMGVDGIIIMPVHGENYNPRLLRLVLDKFPVVLIDRYLKGIPAAFVGSDNVNAAKKATDYLLDLGHRNISFLSPPMTNTSTIEDRREGFFRSHTERGLAVDEKIWATNLISTIPRTKEKANLTTDVETIKKIIINNPEITSFFIIEYDIALIALEALKSLGKKIPDDISILCFDGPTTYLEDNFFTHVHQREEEMGVGAVKILLKQLESNCNDDKIIIDSDLIIGNSTKNVKA